jgi:preprotein translocase subunit SecE
VGAEVKSMEAKKPQQSTATERTLIIKQVKEFVGDIKSEINKITWTSREELLVYTKIVIGATFAFGMSIYILDLMIQGILSGLNLLLNLYP